MNIYTFPIQVMHPYPTVSNPSFVKDSVSPADSKYFVTAPEPGDKVVFIYGFTVKPFATAFLARSPAMIIESGFEVFVQEVIAAIIIEPWERAYSFPL